MPAEILSLDESYKPRIIVLNLKEAKVLYEILSHQYIHPEFEEAHRAVNRIMKFIKENENEATTRVD